MKSLYRYTGAAARPSPSNRPPWNGRITFDVMAGRTSSPFGIELERSLHAYADGLAARIDDGEPVGRHRRRPKVRSYC